MAATLGTAGTMTTGSAAEEEGLHVTVKCGEHTFKVPCGRGEQSVKWLACVVAERFRLLSQTNGRSRQREMHITQSGVFTPASVTLADGSTVYPSTKVKSLATAGTVSVDLCMEAKHDSTGALTQTTWSALAFNYSDNGRARAEAKRAADLAVAAEAERRKRQAADAEVVRRAEEFTALLSVDPEDGSAVARAAAQEWPFIRIERFTKDAALADQLKLLVVKNFLGLSDLYQFYSGSTDVGSLANMNKTEFIHCLAACRAVDLVKEKKLVDRVFSEANRDRLVESESDAKTLTRFEFLEALFTLAMARFGVDRNTGDKMHIVYAFTKLLHQCLLPRVVQMNLGEVRQAMGDRTILKTISQHHAALHRVFKFYSSRASDQSIPENRDCVSHPEFASLAEDLKWNDEPGTRVNDFTQTAIRQIFVAAQQEDSAIHSGAGMDELVYSEFLEAVARLGAHRYPHSSLPLVEKIRHALLATVALDPVHVAAASAAGDH